MNDTSNGSTRGKFSLGEYNLVSEYTRQLEAHLASPSESVLHHAYELGRQAVSDGISVLDMSILHHNALRNILGSHSPAIHEVIIDKANIFFSECLSPFEMLLRRYRDSNASLLAERKVIEQQLHQIQKMEAVGQLTGGIAHDFNNLLVVIVGNVELLLESAQGNAAQIELITSVMNTALRGAELTRRLLAFARKQPLNPSTVDLNEWLPGTAKILQRILGEGIRISTALADGLWLTQVDASQIEDALINLAINARDAMPKGGNLTIETANVTLDKRYAARHLEVTPGDYVMLSVTDTGCGMPPEVIERAAEPFFTTKPQGKGTGLGLSMIYGFVRQSGGHLKIESEVDKGTTIRLYLPKTDSKAQDSRAANTLKAAPRGGEKILLVDDNPELRQLVSRQLDDLGYKVRIAEDGPSAVAILNSGETFDLLFTDIGMPGGMTGFDLAEVAQKRDPRLKVLFTTGYGMTAKESGENPPEPMHVLRKPYRKQELAEKLRAVLDSSK